MSTVDRIPAAAAETVAPPRRRRRRAWRRLPLLLLPLAALAAWQAVVWLAEPRDWLLPSNICRICGFRVTSWSI